MLIEQTQDRRQVMVTTALGADVVLLERLIAEEALSVPFNILVDVVSEKGELDFMPHLGTGVAVTMLENRQVSRSFHGVLWEAQEIGDASQGVRYRLTLRPWTALLAQGLNSRIFQNQSVVDIARKVFDDSGFSGFDLSRLTRGYAPREYCVQFRESDWAFVARLFEEEGIYFHFEHDEGAHTLVACDDPSCHKPGPNLDQVPYVRPGNDRSRRRTHLWRWSERVSTAPQRVALRDFHFIKSAERFESKEEGRSESVNDIAELYDFPGGYTVYGENAATKEGRRYAADRLQAARADMRRFSGEGNAFGLACGALVTLTEHYHPPFNQAYTLVAARHHITAETYRSGGGGGFELDVAIEAVPATTVWRAPLRTPKPVAGGPQTATVVGPKGEVIHVDKWGRVKVQFHWDRQGQYDDKASCWIRVSQAWADSAFGTMMIPRIGEEVVVDFLDGDPDQPLIIGRVYNNAHVVPYALPADKTRSTWKSRTVGKAGDYAGAEEPPKSDQVGFNELRFEDKGGAEEVYVHAQRDLTEWVRLDETRKTGRDAKRRVGRDRKTEIKRHETTVVETGDETRTVKAGSRKTTIKKDDRLTVESGDYSVTVSKGKALVEAKQEIKLKVGSSTITVTPTGIEVQATMITIKAKAMLKAEAPVSEVQGQAMLTLKGGIVLIN